MNRSRLAAALSAFFIFGALGHTLGAQVVAARFDQIAATATFPAGVSLSFANDIAEIGDVDGDGTRDFAVADAAYHGSQSVFNLLNIGAVHVFSGTGQPAPLLYSIFGAVRAGYLGWTVTAIDDVDGDGIEDFVVGIPGGSTIPGSIQTRSGVNGALIATVNNPFAGGSFFGFGVDVGPDYDGDGLRDLAVAEIGGVAICAPFGTVLGTFTSSNTSPGVFTAPATVRFIGDVDGDGSPDLAIGEPNLDQVEIFSGNLGSLGTLLVLHAATAAGTRFGQSLTTDLDFDGDGMPELVIGEPAADSISMFAGNAVSGAAPVAVATAPTGSRFGFSLGNRSLVGGSRVLAGLPGTAPSVFGALQSSKGTLAEWTMTAPAPFAAVGYGSRVVGVSDRNGDGHGEMAICSGRLATPGLAVGQAWVIFGAGPAAVSLSGAGCGVNVLIPTSALVPDPTNILIYVTAPANVGGLAALFMGQPAAPVQVSPGCFAYLDLATVSSATFTVTSSTMNLAIPIPAAANLLNTTTGFQVAIITPASTVETSNAAILQFGY